MFEKEHATSPKESPNNQPDAPIPPRPTPPNPPKPDQIVHNEGKGKKKDT